MRRFIQTVFALICLACLAPGLASARDFDSTTKAQLNTKVDAALANLYASVPGSQDVTSRAKGVLVFPRSGFMVGGQHGGGALRVDGQNVGYYYSDRMTYDVRPGSREHSVAIAFMTQDALQRFQAGDSWDVGADPSVAVVTAGAGGKVDASQLDKPVQIFVFGDNGLMGPVVLQGAKVTKVG
jgi:lipid-binding SYLF domain-containing protein